MYCFWPLQPRPRFANKAKANPSGVPLRWSTLRWAPDLTHNQQISLESPVSDKHYCLLQKFVNYGRKKFYNIWPRSLAETVTVAAAEIFPSRRSRESSSRPFTKEFTNKVTGNTKGGSIIVPLISCLDWSVSQIKRKIVSSHTADFQPVKQEFNGTVILPPLVFPEGDHQVREY